MRAPVSLINRYRLLFHFKHKEGWDVEEALEEAFEKLSKYKVK
jgi:hypothetical protein